MNKRAGRVRVHVESIEDAADAVADAHRARRGEKSDPDFLSMRLLGKDRPRLKRIVAQMLKETDLEEGESISFAGAARYAFRRCLEKA